MADKPDPYLEEARAVVASSDPYLDEARSLVANVTGNTAYSAAKAIGAAGESIDPVQLAVERERAKLVPPGPKRKLVQTSRAAATKSLGAFRKSANRTGAVAKRAPDLEPDYRAEAIQAVKDAVARTIPGNVSPELVETAKKYGGNALTGVLGLVDAPQRQVRHLTTPGRPASLTSLTGEKPTDISNAEWSDKIREAARAGHPGYKALEQLGQVPGEIASPLVTAAVTPFRAAADVVSGRGLPDVARLEQYRKETAQDIGDFARASLTDPLLAVGGFKSGGAKVAEQIGAVGREAGVEAGTLQKIVSTFLKEHEASNGPRESFEAGLRALREALVPKLGEEGALRKLKDTFGQHFEFLGREGLQLGAGPLKVEVPVQKLVKKSVNALGVGENLFRHEKDFAQVAAKRSKAVAQRITARSLDEWTPVAELASKEGVTPERLDALIQRGTTGAIELGEAASQAEQRVLNAARDVLNRQELRLRTAGVNAPSVTAPKSVEPRVKGFAEALSAGAKEQGRQIGQRFLYAELSKQFPEGVPDFVRHVLESTHSDKFASLSKAIASSKIFGDATGDIARVVAWWERQTNAMKRGVLMKRPGYHALNVWNDSLNMYGAGMNNLPKWLNRADNLLQAAKNGDATALRVLQEAQHEGIAADVLERADYQGQGLDVVRSGKELRRVAAGKAPKAWWTKLDETGDAFASRWENTSKLAMYLWGREQGMPSWAAAKSAFDNLIDYSDRSRALQIARWFAPFITWAWKSPEIALRQFAQNPARIARAVRGVNQFAGEEYNQPRSYQGDQGAVKALPKPLEELYSAGRQAVGGTPVEPGEVTEFRPRLGWEDAAQLPIQAGKFLQGEGRPILGQLGPLSKIAYESIAQQDIGTGQPVHLKPTGLLPAQAAPPWVPRALVTTGPNEHGWIPRHLVGSLPGFRDIGPAATIGANLGLNALGVPGSYFGFNRPLTYDRNPADAWFNPALSFLTGVQTLSTLPEGATWSVAHSPEVQSATEKGKFAKSIQKQERKRKRKE